MIECRPVGICSWDFELRGESHVARLGFGWPTEQGWICVDGKTYEVQKQGIFSGSWHLVDRGGVILRAEKQTAFTRTFEISGPSGSYELVAEFFSGRTMRLRGPGTDARIVPSHMFTRRALIKGRLPDFETLAFAFWLTALTWRRAANNASAS